MLKLLCAVTLVFAVMSGPCEDGDAYREASRQADLRKRVNQYHDRFSWRDFDAASLYVSKEMRLDFMNYADGLRRGYTVEAVTIRDIKVSESSKQAAVMVRRSFIKSPSVILQTSDITQEWAFKNGGWYLTGPPY